MRRFIFYPLNTGSEFTHFSKIAPNPLTEDPVSSDSHLHMKQPYYNGVETAQLDGPRTRTKVLDISGVRANPSITDSVTYGSDWLGRGEFNWRQSLPQTIGRNWAFGPYILNPGEKLRITIAEVCGYGAARQAQTVACMTYGRTYLHDQEGSTGNVSTGGRTGEAGSAFFAFYGVPNYWVIHPQLDLNQLTLNPTILHGSDYLTKYPKPEYLNSDVITVREVADRAIQAYNSGPLINHDDSTLAYWPEQYNEHGVYALPIPVPAPAIVVENTAQGENRITWGPHVESFSAPRLQGAFHHYELYKSAHPLGHWQQLATVSKGDPLYFKNGVFVYVQTVVAQGGDGKLKVRGLFIGDDIECFNLAADLSLKVNFEMLDAPLKKVVVYLYPSEFKSTWLGNKSVYRTRMAIADGGELIVLAPGLKEFGEDKQIDALIRKYGYVHTPDVLQYVKENEDLKNNLSAAAHLIHGTSEGRFSITYCPGHLSRQEIESVKFNYADPGQMMNRYDPKKLSDGFNTTSDGETIFFISNPALGLWAYKKRFDES